AHPRSSRRSFGIRAPVPTRPTPLARKSAVTLATASASPDNHHDGGPSSATAPLDVASSAAASISTRPTRARSADRSMYKHGMAHAGSISSSFSYCGYRLRGPNAHQPIARSPERATSPGTSPAISSVFISALLPTGSGRWVIGSRRGHIHQQPFTPAEVSNNADNASPRSVDSGPTATS